MKPLFTLILLTIGVTAFGQSNYYAKQASNYTSEVRDAMDKAK